MNMVEKNRFKMKSVEFKKEAMTVRDIYVCLYIYWPQTF